MKPAPVQVTVCGQCGQPWDKHLCAATGLAQDEMWDYDESSEVPQPTLEQIDAQLTTDICVALLMVANRGPQGAPGVQGPMGAAGRDLR